MSKRSAAPSVLPASKRIAVEEEAKPVPVSIPSSGNEDVKATHDRKLELPRLPFQNPYKGGFYYVRTCYDGLYQLVEKDVLSGEWYTTVTGTPGIGKSLFYAYFFDRFRKAHGAEWTIIAIAVQNNGEMSKLTVFEEGKDPKNYPLADLKLLSEVVCELTDKKPDRKILYLCDGPPKIMLDPMVVFTSPNEQWVNLPWKTATTLFMPVWTRDELQEAAVVLELPIDDDAIDERFETFGGVAWMCFDDNEYRVESVLSRMNAAMNKVTKVEEITNLLLEDDVWDMLLYLIHYVPDNTRQEKRNAVASPVALDKLTKRLLELSKHHKNGMQMKLKEAPETAVLYDHIFKVDVHQALSGHCALSVRLLTEGSALVSQDKFVLAKSETVDVFDTSSLSTQMLTRGPYHKPRSGTLESIDSFYLPKISVNAGQKVTQSAVVEWNNRHCLLLFQVTISKTHPVKASEIIYLLTKLELLESFDQYRDRVALVFVAPDDIVGDFKQQEIIPVSTARPHSLPEISGIGRITAAILAQEYSITKVDELEVAIKELHRGTFRLKDDRHRAGWVRAVSSWEKQVQPIIDLRYNDIVGLIPQYVCSIGDVETIPRADHSCDSQFDAQDS